MSPTPSPVRSTAPIPKTSSSTSPDKRSTTVNSGKKNDVTEKAAKRIQTIGGVYGANNKPTRFLCLVLKLLQIQPEDEIVEEWIHNEDFRYVRALGAFYARLTGRPHSIYEWLEPLLYDYRKLRCRDSGDWSVVHVDEFIEGLLRDGRMCGIAMPRLPDRKVLEEAGYLDGPRRSALGIGGGEEAEEMLEKMARDGCAAAVEAVRERRRRLGLHEDQDEGELHESSDAMPSNSPHHSKVEKKNEENGGGERSRSRSRSPSWGRNRRSPSPHRSHSDRRRRRDDHHRTRERRGYDVRKHGDSDRHRRSKDYDDRDRTSRRHHHRESHRDTSRHRDDRRERKHRHRDSSSHSISDKSYGTLFKKSCKDKPRKPSEPSSSAPEEGSKEYWNEQRAKLGLKPLK